LHATIVNSDVRNAPQQLRKTVKGHTNDYMDMFILICTLPFKTFFKDNNIFIQQG